MSDRPMSDEHLAHLRQLVVDRDLIFPEEAEELLAEMDRLRRVEELARKCITPSGHVVLALCKPLSDVLYTQGERQQALPPRSPSQETSQ